MDGKALYEKTANVRTRAGNSLFRINSARPGAIFCKEHDVHVRIAKNEKPKSSKTVLLDKKKLLNAAINIATAAKCY